MKKFIILSTILFISNVSSQTHEDYNEKGFSKGILGDYKGAIADFTKAIQIKLNDTSFYNRGTAKAKLEDYRGAIVDFNRAIELNPNYAEAYNNRGIAKSRLEDYRGAIADYTKAIQIKPNDSSYYNNKGLAKIYFGQKDSGCLDLSRAGELGFDVYDSIRRLCN